MHPYREQPERPQPRPSASYAHKRVSLRALVLLLLGCFVVGVIATDATRASAYPPWSGTGLSSNWTNATQTPVLNPYWSVAHWFLDLGNSTGVAADTPSCGQSSGSPCLTWHHLNDQLWGCFGSPTACPRLLQNTVIEFMSGGTNEPILFYPTVENDSLLQVIGDATLVKSYTGGLSIVAKTRGGPGQLLNATFDASAAIKQLAANSTHASHAWTYKSLGANAFAMTQPQATGAFPRTVRAGEVDTWASGDTVTLSTVPKINLVAFVPTMVTVGSGSVNAKAYLSTLEISDQDTSGNWVTLNTEVRAFDVLYDKMARVIGGTDPVNVGGSSNSVYLAGFSQETPTNTAWTVTGGWIGGTAVGAGTSLDADLILNAAFGGLGTNFIGFLYLDSSGVLSVASGNIRLININSYGGQQLWGSGSSPAISVTNSSHFQYPSGASGAANNLTQTGAININGGTVACIAKPSAASSFATCNTTVSNANLDTNLGATGGCLAVGGGGAVCNI